MKVQYLTNQNWKSIYSTPILKWICEIPSSATCVKCKEQPLVMQYAKQFLMFIMLCLHKVDEENANEQKWRHIISSIFRSCSRCAEFSTSLYCTAVSFIHSFNSILRGPRNNAPSVSTSVMSKDIFRRTWCALFAQTPLWVSQLELMILTNSIKNQFLRVLAGHKFT